VSDDYDKIGGPLSGAEVTSLIIKAKAGQLTPREQMMAGYSLDFYRGAAIRTEAAIHRMVKMTEHLETT